MRDKNIYLTWNKIYRLCSYYLFFCFLFLILASYFTFDFIQLENGLWKALEDQQINPDYLPGFEWFGSITAILWFTIIPILILFIIATLYRWVYRKKIGLSDKRFELGVIDAAEYIAWFAIITTILQALSPLEEQLSISQISLWGIAWQSVEQVVMILLAVFLFRADLSLMHWQTFKRPLLNLFQIFLAFIAIYFVISPVSIYLNESIFHISMESYRNEIISDWVTKAKETSLIAIILQTVNLVVITPIAEEIFCRGIIHRSFANRFGALIGSIISSLFFSFLHLDLAAALPIFLMSLLLAYVYEKSKSIWAPILLHALNNGAYLVFIIWQT